MSDGKGKRVYICAPLGGNIAGNVERAKRYTKYALFCGAAPVTPHFYALCLDDGNPKEREMGLRGECDRGHEKRNHVLRGFGYSCSAFQRAASNKIFGGNGT